jgi:amino acid adenylation domain-containing protein/thioester reductase-like protein
MCDFTSDLEAVLVHQLFEVQVSQSPDSIAVDFEGEQLTYLELNHRANHLARHLQFLGVAPNRLVGICMDRSIEMIVALLAVLKAGGAYLPLDPGYPSDRLAFMVQDAQISLLLSQSHLVTHLPTQGIQLLCLDTDWSAVINNSALNLAGEVLAGDVSVEDLAYVIYTSGSTGRPKGVAMPHRPLVNLITWQLKNSTVSSGKTLQFSPISFDVSFQEIFSTFAAGGTLVLVSDALRRDALKLLRFLEQAAIERLFLPFIALQYLAEAAVTAGITPTHLREVITAGEQLRITSAIAHWFTQLNHCTLHNQYGPSESHVVTAFTLTGSPQEWALLPPIGKAIANTQIYLLDEQLQPVPVGDSGELYLGGVCLARGYLNRPDLTEERFIPNPFSAQTGDRLYKTGDLARSLPDGMIEYLGRADQQVKIRGYRIEPGEIESILENHPAVRESVVIAREDVPGDKCLVAYAVFNPADAVDHAPAPNELRQFLRGQLPEYMVPSAVVLLDEFPLTPSGKVDRRSLPTPDRNVTSEQLTAPQSPTETELAAIWADVLGIQQIGVDHSFIELGGHSLLAAQIVYRIRDAFQVELPLSSLFETPTIKELAIVLEKSQQDGCCSQLLPIEPISRDRNLPLSLMQEPLWFLDQLVPNNPFYNVPEVFRLNGSVNIGALEHSFQQIIQRHEALRSTFASLDGKPVQVIHPAPNFRLPVVDLTLSCQLSDLYSTEETQAWQFILKEARLPFDLSNDLLLRATLFKLNETESLLFVNLHHIVCDGKSVDLLLQELAAHYTAFTSGQVAQLPELTIQSADFAVWHRQWLHQVREKQLAYWQQQLGNSLPVLQLPTDYPRSPRLTYQGSRHFLTLSQSLMQALKDLSRREETTLFMTLLAAFQSLLSYYTGQNDIPIGSLFSNRHHPKLDQVIGFFVNTVVLRTDSSGSPTFQQLLGRVKHVALDAYAHQDLPFDEVVQALQPDRDLNQNPLFQVLFNLQTTSTLSWELADVTLTRLPLDNGTAKFDLFLELTETPEGITGYFEYSTDLFSADTIARMAGHFQTLLESIVVNPSQTLSDICLLAPAEQQQLHQWNQTQADISLACVHELFEQQVERTPDAIAVEFEGQHLTYRELNQRANQLAHHLQTLGIQPDVLVGICVERSLDMMVGLLGTLKAGGAYVPLDPSYPQARLAFMLEDSRIPVLLTQHNLLEQLPPHTAQVICLDTDWEKIAIASPENLDSGVTNNQLAYTIYTSGSTGNPKGVQIEHQALTNFLHSMRQEPGLTVEDVLVAVTTISFDIAGLELYLPLIVGARVVLVSREVASDAAQLVRTLQQSSATVMQATPATWRMLLAAGWQGDRQLKLLCGGEALPRELANQLLERSHSLWNMYGPTETTIWSAVHRVEPEDGAVVAGRAIANTQIYISNQPCQHEGKVFYPAPVGVPGEVYIGGAGLARGYLNRSDLTAERFISVQMDGSEPIRLYRTGDLGRYRSDGTIELMGRIDHQVKIRGFRIESGEIEAALNQHPLVREAVVTAHEDQSGEKSLVAYIVSNSTDLESESNPIPAASNLEQTQQWQTIWNEAYSQSTVENDPTFNISGWNSSYTGRLTPVQEMQEWVKHTVERILSLRPNRVLEIGCGTGLLLFRVAPQCSDYCGIDISTAAIGYIKQQIQQNQLHGSQVRLAVGSADTLDEFGAEEFDTIVMNSVVQYFPNIHYLVRVLENAVKRVKPGGRIFIGDVRHLSLLQAFHTSVQLYQADDRLSTSELNQRIRDRVTQDRELVIDPNFFVALKQHLPQINHVEIQLKRGSYHNELTCFRYDVVLHVGAEVDLATEPIWLDWQPDLTPSTIRQYLNETQPEILGLRHIKNARTAHEMTAIHLLECSDRPETVGELRAALNQTAQPAGIDPEDLWSLSEDLPYTIFITGSETAGDYNVFFRRNPIASLSASQAIVPAFPQAPVTLKPWRTYANNPLQVDEAAHLIPQIRVFLKGKLPDYMIPSTFMVMDALPLTPNGKVDRRALPAPNRERSGSKAAFVAPRTPIEETLAAIWAKILGFDDVGVQDNFFEMGGHSLLAAQLLSQIETTFQVKLSLANVFMAPTIENLAQIIVNQQQGSSVSLPAPNALDLWSEAVLDPAIAPQSNFSSVDAIHAPNHVLLTGATGFLGAFLLHELLEQTQATVYCLVRGTSAQEASQKIQRNLSTYSLWKPDQGSRIIPVVGDLSLPFLGLSSQQFDTLGKTIDVIYHNGGQVNFVYPYSMLKTANVIGTQEVLRLAGQGQIKPVHFISTMGVFSPIAYTDGQIIREQDVPDRPEGLYGYTQSKWVAEKLMAIAHARGIPTVIHRPAWIEGHSQTGACNRSDFFRSLIKGCIQMGLAPDWNMPVDITPVDFISRAIVHLSKQSTSLGKAYNFSNPHAISWNQLVNWIQTLGYPLQQIPYQQWIAEVSKRVSQAPENALHPFLEFLTEPHSEHQMSVPEIYFQTKSIHFDCQTLMEGLINMTEVYPPIDDKLLNTYFSYFIQTGFLEAP